MLYYRNIVEKLAVKRFFTIKKYSWKYTYSTINVCHHELALHKTDVRQKNFYWIRVSMQKHAAHSDLLFFCIRCARRWWRVLFGMCLFFAGGQYIWITLPRRNTRFYQSVGMQKMSICINGCRHSAVFRGWLFSVMYGANLLPELGRCCWRISRASSLRRRWNLLL